MPTGDAASSANRSTRRRNVASRADDRAGATDSRSNCAAQANGCAAHRSADRGPDGRRDRGAAG
jgi:hypothetical protein